MASSPVTARTPLYRPAPEEFTRHQNARYVVLGGPTPGIYSLEGWPMAEWGYNAPLFPISFMTPCYNEALALFALQPFIRRIESLPAERIKSELTTSSELDIELNRDNIYPVLFGKSRRPCIYTVYADAYADTNNFRFAKFLGVPSVRMALLYQTIRPPRPGMGGLEDSIAELVSTFEDFTVGGTDNTAPRPCAALLPRVDNQHPQDLPPSYDEANIATSTNGPTLSNHSDGSGSEIESFFCHQRDETGGILRSYTEAPPTQDVIVYSFGPILDSFLDAFGYRDSVLTAISMANQFSDSKEEFVDDLVERGMARTEAEWVWKWLDRSTRQRIREVPSS